MRSEEFSYELIVQSINRLNYINMVHLSRFPIDDKKLSNVFSLLFEIVDSTSDQNDFLLLIKDIISPPEQIMVAKRMAIVYLLIKGVQNNDIVDYLKVSSATVAKFSLLFYEKDTLLILTIKRLLKKEKISNFFEDLFADLFIQPGIKIGHWQRHWQHKKRQIEREMIDT